VILSVSGQVASESSRQWRFRRPPMSSRCAKAHGVVGFAVRPATLFSIRIW
jgi:hypothetical protein